MFAKNNINFLLHPWNFEKTKADNRNGGHERMPDIPIQSLFFGSFRKSSENTRFERPENL